MYFLFSYTNFYPDGGMGDYKGGFDTIEQAIDEAQKNFADTYEIVTLRDGDYINPAGLVVIKHGTSKYLLGGEFTITWEDCEE